MEPLHVGACSEGSKFPDIFSNVEEDDVELGSGT